MANNLCERIKIFTILATCKLKGGFCDSTSKYIKTSPINHQIGIISTTRITMTF